MVRHIIGFHSFKDAEIAKEILEKSGIRFEFNMSPIDAYESIEANETLKINNSSNGDIFYGKEVDDEDIMLLASVYSNNRGLYLDNGMFPEMYWDYLSLKEDTGSGV